MADPRTSAAVRRVRANSGYTRTLTDDEVRALGYTHRDRDGHWRGLDRLTPMERAARDRQRARARHALEHPLPVVNPDAMRDGIVDAFGDRLTVGSIRRGEHLSAAADNFDWDAVRQRVDEEHADAIDCVVQPRHSQQHPESRPTFSVVRAARSRARTRNYGTAALDGECWRVAQTSPRDPNNTQASAAFKCGQLVGAGLVEENDAYSNLLGAAIDSGLSEREARPVVRSGLRAGARRPRVIA